MKTTPQIVLYGVLLAIPAGLLSGCSANFVSSPVVPEQVPIGNIQGSVHGGQAPVSGAHIYLYAAGTGGYGTNATSLIKDIDGSTFEDGSGNYYAVTDANGNFALGGDYTCTEGTQVYMVAVGGNPGMADPNTNNTAIVQMAGLGQCPAAGNLAAQVPYLVINEVTTVAFAYSMGGFGSTAYNISSNAANSPASATAIANAMANAGNIVNLQWGQAPAVANGNPNSVNPQATIYALANILATCVNTSGPTSSACQSLFSAAKDSSGSPATDEASAIFNIVHNPANTANYATHVNDIWNLTTGTPVFSPTLASAPTDWTMPVIYNALVSVPQTVGNQIVSGPYNIAFDANGNAWIGDRVKGVVEVGPQGAANTYNDGFGMVKGIAVSPADGTIWVSDYNNSKVYVLDTSGNIVTTVIASIYNKTTPRGPILTSFALDPGGPGYLAYQANEEVPGVVVFDNIDTDTSIPTRIDYRAGSTYFPNVDTPGWIAIDQTGQAWLPSTDTLYTANLTVSNNNGAMTYKADQSAGPESYSTASDGHSNIWLTTDTGTATLEEILSGATSPTMTQTGGGMNEPYKLAVDGGNTIWIANDGANTVSAWSQNGNGSWLATNGFSTSAASGTGCVVLGVDGSGNVWTGNADGSVTQLLGLATPTATPFYGGMTVVTGTGINKTTTITAGNLGTKP